MSPRPSMLKSIDVMGRGTSSVYAIASDLISLTVSGDEPIFDFIFGVSFVFVYPVTTYYVSTHT